MGVQIQGKNIDGLVIGDTTFVEQGWIPLKLGANVNGFVFFKDNKDGTGSITGTANVGAVTNGVLVYAPSGFKFSSVPGNGSINGLAGEYPVYGTLTIDGAGNIVCKSDGGFNFVCNSSMTAYNEDWNTSAMMKITKIKE